MTTIMDKNTYLVRHPMGLEQLNLQQIREQHYSSTEDTTFELRHPIREDQPYFQPIREQHNRLREAQQLHCSELNTTGCLTYVRT